MGGWRGFSVWGIRPRGLTENLSLVFFRGTPTRVARLKKWFYKSLCGLGNNDMHCQKTKVSVNWLFY